jgi:hypothetical protein
VEKFKRRRSDASRLTLSEQKEFLRAMPTPAAVAPENVHLYRAAALAWRTTWRKELRRNDGNHKLANPHVPLHAAALAVKTLAPEMTLDQARTFAQKAVAWAAQAHNEWSWRGTSTE